MSKVYKVVAIDDQPIEMEKILVVLTKYVKMNFGYELNCSVYSRQTEFERLPSEPIDVVMFDLALNGSNFKIEGEATKWGFELIKKFRADNKRTKIIFYSGKFDLKDSASFDFTSLEFVKIINELNVFALIPRGDYEMMAKTLVRAIESIDSVLVSLEELILIYGEDGMFLVGEDEYTAEEMLKALRVGSPVGEMFRKQVTETIVAYFMKFGD